MSGQNRPTLAHCPLCGATAFNPSLGKEKIRLYCESCRRFIYIGPRKPYRYVVEDLKQTFRYLLGIQANYPKPGDEEVLRKAAVEARQITEAARAAQVCEDEQREAIELQEQKLARLQQDGDQ